MIISVDHGNKSIKTPRLLFTSGLIESDTRPGIKTDCIFWNVKYYTLTEKRISYLRDKTEDDRFYVLTLFAIAKELELDGIMEPDEELDIDVYKRQLQDHHYSVQAVVDRPYAPRNDLYDYLVVESEQRCV